MIYYVMRGMMPPVCKRNMTPQARTKIKTEKTNKVFAKAVSLSNCFANKIESKGAGRERMKLDSKAKSRSIPIICRTTKVIPGIRKVLTTTENTTSRSMCFIASRFCASKLPMQRRASGIVKSASSSKGSIEKPGKESGVKARIKPAIRARKQGFRRDFKVCFQLPRREKRA